MRIELINYRLFGYQCPVAILLVGQSIQAYTFEGMQSLANQFETDQLTVSYLREIGEKLEILKDADIEEISFDDVKPTCFRCRNLITGVPTPRRCGSLYSTSLVLDSSVLQANANAVGARCL